MDQELRSWRSLNDVVGKVLADVKPPAASTKSTAHK
jgi:hypothetical protein